MQDIKTEDSVLPLFLGVEQIYPDQKIIGKVRYVLQKFLMIPASKEDCLQDFFSIVQEMGHYPVTPFFKNLVEANNEVEKIDATLKLIDHLSYRSYLDKLRLLFGKAEVKSEDREEAFNIFVSFLDELSLQENMSFCLDLKSILLEEDPTVQIKKMITFYRELYDEPRFERLLKSYDHLMAKRESLQFLKFVEIETQIPLFKVFFGMINKGLLGILNQAFSKGQILSKLWAVEELDKLTESSFKKVLVLCGWYGVLGYLMGERLGEKVNLLRSVDIDSSCELIADKFNQKRLMDGWKFKAVTEDIFNINYENINLPLVNKKGESFREYETFDLIVNTSCEHIKDFAYWYGQIPSGQMVLLQSNNFFDVEEHVNCKASLKEFKESAPLNTVLFEGELELPLYTRYMLIGYK